MNTQSNPMPTPWDVKAKLTANALKQRLPRTPRAAYKPAKPMLKHEITAGIGFDKDGEHIASSTQQVHAIRLHLAAEFGGYSETIVRGGYMHANGEFVNEESRTWTIVTDKPIEPACEFIRAALNQESVLLVSTEPKLVKFVGASHV